MPPKSGIFGNVSDLPYPFLQEYRSLPFSDRYRTALNTNRRPREISHRYLLFHRLSQLCLLSPRRSPRRTRRSRSDFPSGQTSARGDVDFRQPVHHAIGRVRRGTYPLTRPLSLNGRSIFTCLISLSSSPPLWICSISPI